MVVPLLGPLLRHPTLLQQVVIDGGSSDSPRTPIHNNPDILTEARWIVVPQCLRIPEGLKNWVASHDTLLNAVRWINYSALLLTDAGEEGHGELSILCLTSTTLSTYNDRLVSLVLKQLPVGVGCNRIGMWRILVKVEGVWRASLGLVCLKDFWGEQMIYCLIRVPLSN